MLPSVGSRVWAQESWGTGLAALRNTGSSRARGGTRVPYNGRQILNHYTTREVPLTLFFVFKNFNYALNNWCL